MILKKPFALLIKNFKLIHLILSVFISYLVYKTSAMLNFITDYSVLPTNLVSPDVTDSLFPLLLYFIPAFLIIGYTIIIILMKFKEKPITFYVISIAATIFSVVIYVFANSTVSGLEIALTDVRTLKLNQDLLRTVQIVQFIITIMTIIRATGFNIKKFNFSKDLEALAIEEKDNEEFEVNVELDSDKFKRKFRRFKRYSRYIFVENKLLITFASIFLVLGICITIYLNFFVYNKVYKMGERIETSDFYFTFNNGYKTLYDYKENASDYTAYVIVNFDARKKYGTKEKIETARLYLEVNDHLFYHNRKDQNLFFDLGYAYNNEKIAFEKQNYNLIYEIPSTFIDDNMYLVYEEAAGKKVRIKLNLQKLEKATKELTYNLTDTVDFNESLMRRSTLKIETYTLNDFYKNPYQFCAYNDSCYNSFEYIMPSFTGNYNKTLMKLESEFVIDSNIKISKINNLIEFLNYFGELHYVLPAGEKIISDFSIVVPKDTKVAGTYYIEVNSDIKKANNIWFEIVLRDKKYKYVLK